MTGPSSELPTKRFKSILPNDKKSNIVMSTQGNTTFCIFEYAIEFVATTTGSFFGVIVCLLTTVAVWLTTEFPSWLLGTTDDGCDWLIPSIMLVG
jgi:hypothetical protein